MPVNNHDHDYDHEIDFALRRGDPATLGGSTELLDDLVMATRAAVEVETPRTARWQSKRFGVIVGTVAILAVGLVTPAVATGVHYLARTGWFGESPNPGGNSSGASDTEWIDTGSSDFVDYASTILPSYVTLPEGYTRTSFARAEAERFAAAAGPSLTQKVSVVRSFESAARCLWIDEWLTADAAGDTSATTVASISLGATATWPATVATDGGGIVAMYEQLGDSARSGNRSAVQDAYAGDSCGAFLEANDR
ncbi:MAG: hypothetical protein ACOH1T_06915 [Microbacteriaceae bacterium]